ncbi:hypothetical protein ACFSKM_02575 [Ancylobacter dichloromethanicus]
MKIATKPLKQAVIAPSMLSLLYPLDGSLPDYSRERFLSDLCDECEKDIRSAFNAGAKRVSIDFTEGRLACRADPSNPWTGRGMLEDFISLNNRVIDRFSPEERRNIGVHTCPGGDCDSTHSADVDYAELLPSLFKMNAGYFLIQAASEKDKERTYRLIGEHSRVNANGVPQVCFVGVINPQDPNVESPDAVCADILTAARHIPVERLGTTDDCGFFPVQPRSKAQARFSRFRARYRLREDCGAREGNATCRQRTEDLTAVVGRKAGAADCGVNAASCRPSSSSDQMKLSKPFTAYSNETGLWKPPSLAARCSLPTTHPSRVG